MLYIVTIFIGLVVALYGLEYLLDDLYFRWRSWTYWHLCHVLQSRTPHLFLTPTLDVLERYNRRLVRWHDKAVKLHNGVQMLFVLSIQRYLL